MLVPTGVIEIRLCRYTEKFVRGGLVASSRIGTLVEDFDALRPASAAERRKFTSCPFDADPIVAYLAYASGRSLTIYTRMNGCVYATNGDVRRQEPAAARTRLRKTLLQLTAA
jgi:hypothetical protein